MQDPASGFVRAFEALSPRSENYVPDVVRLILESARQGRASDVHLVPGESVTLMQWRIDGVLQPVAGFDRELALRLIARLKVIAGLLTYRTDIPQEGRVAREQCSGEVRVSTFPTLHGEKAAIRLFAGNDQLQTLPSLGLPPAVQRTLEQQLTAAAGVILLTGPSGSGKTTTAYACLRQILSEAGCSRCVMTLEDPIEVAVSGATQSQVRPAAGFDLATAIKSVLRQDPDVILIGEIRDPATAEAAFQAALTGHLVVTTFHAGSTAEAVTRLLEMNVEPYLLRSGLRTVISQRLLRKTAHPASAGAKTGATGNPSDKLAASGDVSFGPTRTGGEYFGRMVLAELMDPEWPDVAACILRRRPAPEIAAASVRAGMVTLRMAADAAVRDNQTTAEEVLRVFGHDPSVP